MIDGLEYHEGLNAVFVKGGVAGNVIPDECVIEVNYRFAPDRDEADAEAFLRDFFDGYDVTVTDAAPGALPGLARPGRGGLPRGGRRRGEPEVRLDRRGPLQRPGRPGGELRTGRPAPRAQAGGARPVRTHRALRAAAAHLAGGAMTDDRSVRKKDKRKGPVLMRRDQVDSGTTDQRLLDSRGPSDWVHTDPWRVMRIPSEFVEGFGAARRARPGDQRLRLGPHGRDRPVVRGGREARPQAGRGGLRGDHRRWPGRDGGRQQGRQRGRRRQRRPRHRAALRDRPQPVGRRRASTSATSSPARRCS